MGKGQRPTDFHQHRNITESKADYIPTYPCVKSKVGELMIFISALTLAPESLSDVSQALDPAPEPLICTTFAHIMKSPFFLFNTTKFIKQNGLIKRNKLISKFYSK